MSINSQSGLIRQDLPPSQYASELFQGRLERVDDTHVGLVRAYGNRIYVNGSILTLPVAGLQRATTDNVITNTGADSGAAMAASTIYNMYVSNLAATFAPGELRASTTAPNLNTDGVYRLGNAGNALNWLWVGAIYTTAATLIISSINQIHVASYFNQRWTRAHIDIGFVDNNAVDTFNLASATYAAIKAGGAIGGVDTCSIVDLGFHDFNISWKYTYTTAAANARGGIAVAGATIIECSGGMAVSATPTGQSVIFARRAGSQANPNIFVCFPVARADAAGIITFYGDVARDGATIDPPACTLAITSLL